MKVVILVAVFLSLGTVSYAQEKTDFNTRLVIKLSEILGVKPPTKIKIEMVSQKEMLEDYREYLMAQCMGGRVQRFEYCAQTIKVEGVFVHGVWIPEKDGSLHIKIHKNSGMDAVVHEFCHWYLNQMSPLLNNHTALESIVNVLLSSPPLLEWLEKEQK